MECSERILLGGDMTRKCSAVTLPMRLCLRHAVLHHDKMEEEREGEVPAIVSYLLLSKSRKGCKRHGLSITTESCSAYSVSQPQLVPCDRCVVYWLLGIIGKALGKANGFFCYSGC